MRPNIQHIVKHGGEAIFIIEIKSGFCIIDRPFSEQRVSIESSRVSSFLATSR